MPFSAHYADIVAHILRILSAEMDAETIISDVKRTLEWVLIVQFHYIYFRTVIDA
jgi:hypothetical protein